MDSGWATVVLSGVLSAITGIYVWLTWKISKSSSQAAAAAQDAADSAKRSADEMEKQRQLAYRPIINITGIQAQYSDRKLGCDAIRFALQNIGKGPAVDVVVLANLPGTQWRGRGPMLEYPATMPADSETLWVEVRKPLGIGDIPGVVMAREEGILLIEYSDISGNKYQTNAPFFIDNQALLIDFLQRIEFVGL